MPVPVASANVSTPSDPANPKEHTKGLPHEQRQPAHTHTEPLHRPLGRPDRRPDRAAPASPIRARLVLDRRGLPRVGTGHAGLPPAAGRRRNRRPLQVRRLPARADHQAVGDADWRADLVRLRRLHRLVEQVRDGDGASCVGVHIRIERGPRAQLERHPPAVRPAAAAGRAAWRWASTCRSSPSTPSVSAGRAGSCAASSSTGASRSRRQPANARSRNTVHPTARAVSSPRRPFFVAVGRPTTAETQSHVRNERRPP